jgi:transcriptional regulator with XRE-family HTH domain
MSPRPKTRQIDTTEFSGRVAARIDSLRQEQLLSTQALADKITKAGYSLGVQTLYGWLAGTRDVALDAIPAIAKALGVKVHDLIPTK